MKKYFLVVFLFISTFSIAQKKTTQNDFQLAENYYRQGEYEKATQIYKKLYDKSPFNTTYLNRLITCYQQTDNFKIVENLIHSEVKQLRY